MKTRARSSKWQRCEERSLALLGVSEDWVEVREMAFQLNLSAYYIGVVLGSLLKTGDLERQKIRAEDTILTLYRLKSGE